MSHKNELYQSHNKSMPCHTHACIMPYYQRVISPKTMSLTPNTPMSLTPNTPMSLTPSTPMSLTPSTPMSLTPNTDAVSHPQHSAHPQYTAFHPTPIRIKTKQATFVNRSIFCLLKKSPILNGPFPRYIDSAESIGAQYTARS